MTGQIQAGSQGTPLIVLEPAQYENWLSQQTPTIQKWLTSTRFSGTGHSLVPSHEGDLECVLLVTPLGDFFAGADLATQLPAGEYLLNISAKYALNFAIAWGLGGYRYEHYVSSDKPLPVLTLESSETVEQAQKFIEATYLVRDLVNTPAGDMMPQHLSQVAQDLARQFDGTFSEIVGDELLANNYPTIHAVGRASENKPRLLDIHWGSIDHPKLTLVGKGVCFDSGGLDLKPGSAMRLMKKDMGGAAHVLGLASLIMSHQLPVRLRVLIPAVENAVSGNAFRPGDIIQTRKGLMVEIDNTDAEGRLVLCDALAEADSESPDMIIDFATLTGACRVALGTEIPGFFTNQADMATGLQQAGSKAQDPVWNLPLHKPYRDLLKSDIADIQNCAATPMGGAITAALYLQEFVREETHWAHFDVMAWNTRKLPGRPVGGEAMGMRAVMQFLSEKYL